MGFDRFESIQEGYSAKEAFEKGKKNDEGWGGIDTQYEFEVIEVPKSVLEMEFETNDLTELYFKKDDHWVNDARGKAACIVLEKPIQPQTKKVNIKKITKEGKFEWIILFGVFEKNSGKKVDEDIKESKAIKKAEKLSYETQKAYDIKIFQKLVSHDNQLKVSVVPEIIEGKPGKYLFFGWGKV